MNIVKIECIKTFRHADGRVWLEGETYELTAREVGALKQQMGDDWAKHFTE